MGCWQHVARRLARVAARQQGKAQHQTRMQLRTFGKRQGVAAPGIQSLAIQVRGLVSGLDLGLGFGSQNLSSHLGFRWGGFGLARHFAIWGLGTLLFGV